MAKILVLNGPNLNLLGTREPDIYGKFSLPELMAGLERMASEAGHSLDSFQSNREYELVERVQNAHQDDVVFMILNPAALTHTSIALRDAILAVGMPFIEVHLSNIYAREEFRQNSYFSDIAKGVITGLGAMGYELALKACIESLDQ